MRELERVSGQERLWNTLGVELISIVSSGYRAGKNRRSCRANASWFGCAPSTDPLWPVTLPCSISGEGKPGPRVPDPSRC